ncbi:Serine protease, partial [Rhyzopertha dominica]
MFKLVAILCLVASAIALPRKTKVPRLDGRIVGGEDADIEDYNYTVQLLYFGSHICGGSIISPKYVVTAAHCTDGSTATLLSIRAGSTLRNQGGTVVNVAAIHQNPDFDWSYIDYDISILELAEELEFSSSIGPISLPEVNQIVEAGTNSTVTGWGTTTEGGSLPSILQVVQVPIVSLEECRAAYGQADVTDRMVCAGYTEGGKDACQGDSGGPLVVGDELIGIVSWGYGCARPNYPGVYGSVPAMRDYVYNITGL